MREFFANMEWTALHVFGIWLFIAVFAAVALRIFAFRQPRGSEQLPVPPPNAHTEPAPPPTEDRETDVSKVKVPFQK